MKYIFVWLIRLYQKYLSPLKRNPTCRFRPSCSSYAAEAFIEWGFFVGLGLSVWRVLRCNPFCAGGYDPVPRRRGRRNKINEDADICDDILRETNSTGEEPKKGAAQDGSATRE